MSLVLEIRRRGRHVIGPTFGALVVGYFLFHAVQGERGILALAELKQQVAEAEQTLSRLGARRQTLDARVALLRSGSLDRDLLDERARIAAGLTKPGEIVIFDTQTEFSR
jgi:cell division protein FtsB